MGNSSSRRSSKQDILIRYPKTNESQSSTAERNSPWSERVECNSPSSTAGLDSLSSTVELESSSSKEELESPSSTVGSKSRLPSTESESTKTSDLFPYLAASPLTAPRTTLKLHHFQKEAHFGIPKSLLGSVDQEKRLSHCIAGGDGPTLKDTENRNTKDVDLVSLGQAGYHTDSLIADKSCLKTAIGANDVNDRVRSNTETGVKPLQLGITCSTEATRTAAAKPPVLKHKNLATYADAGSSTGSSDSLARENMPQSTKLVADASTTEDQATQKHFDDRAILAFIPFSPLEVDISLLVGQFQGRHKRRPVFSTKLSAILASKPYQVSLRHEKGALFASRIMSVPKGPVKTPHSQSSSGTQQKGNRAAAKEAKTSVKKPMTPEREVLNLLKATSELPLSKIVPQYKLEYGKTLNYEGKLISWLSSIPDVQVDASKQTVSLRTASRTCSDKNVTHKVRSSSVSSSKEEKRVREADVANSCAQVVSSGAPAVDLRCDASKSHASTPPREEAASSSANPAPQPAKSALGDSVSESAGPTTGTELASFRSRVLDLVKCDNLSVVELYNKYMDVYNEPPKFVDGSLSDALREVPGLRLAGGLLNVMPDSKEIVGSMLENLVSTEPCSLAELTARFKTRYGCLPPATFPLEEYLNMPDKFKLDGSLVSKAEPLPAATSGSLNVVPKADADVARRSTEVVAQGPASDLALRSRTSTLVETMQQACQIRSILQKNLRVRDVASVMEMYRRQYEKLTWSDDLTMCLQLLGFVVMGDTFVEVCGLSADEAISLSDAASAVKIAMHKPNAKTRPASLTAQRATVDSRAASRKASQKSKHTTWKIYSLILLAGGHIHIDDLLNMYLTRCGKLVCSGTFESFLLSSGFTVNNGIVSSNKAVQSEVFANPTWNSFQALQLRTLLRSSPEPHVVNKILSLYKAKYGPLAYPNSLRDYLESLGFSIQNNEIIDLDWASTGLEANLSQAGRSGGVRSMSRTSSMTSVSSSVSTRSSNGEELKWWGK